METPLENASELGALLTAKKKYERRLQELKTIEHPLLHTKIIQLWDEILGWSVFKMTFAKFEESPKEVKDYAYQVLPGGAWSNETNREKMATHGFLFLKLYTTQYRFDPSHGTHTGYGSGASKQTKFRDYIERCCGLAFFDFLLDQLDEQLSTLESARAVKSPQGNGGAAPSVAFVDSSIIEELKGMKTPSFDLTGLAKMCGELNRAYSSGDYISVSAMVRTIMNHVPTRVDTPLKR